MITNAHVIAGIGGGLAEVSVTLWDGSVAKVRAVHVVHAVQAAAWLKVASLSGTAAWQYGKAQGCPTGCAAGGR